MIIVCRRSSDVVVDELIGGLSGELMYRGG